METTNSYVQFNNVSKVYKSGEIEIKAVDDVSFTVEKGEFCVIVGASGSGKTTALNILGGMDNATSGEVIIDGVNITKLNNKKLTEFRRHDVGFVFQFYNLVPNLTALENVELATQMSRDALDEKTVLEMVGLADRMDNFPSQLSGGEQQRVSIARALAKNPKILLCDEPTGALDYKTGVTILKLLQQASRESGMTVIVITHNQAIAPMADRIISMGSGKINSIKINREPVDVERIVW